MKINLRYRKLLAIALTATMVLTPVHAFGDEPVVEETAETESVAGLLSEEAEELEELTPGVDYVDREGVFLCENRQEAERIAAEYDAELISFDYGVATVRFRESTKAALNSAALSGVEDLIEPNYTYELFDTEDVDYSEYAASDSDTMEETIAGDGVVSGSDSEETVDDDGAFPSDEGEEIAAEEVGDEASVDEEVTELYGDTDSDAGLDSAYLSDGTPDPFASSSDEKYQYYHEKIHDIKAHEIATGKNIRVAVIDSGCNPKHEDLQGKVSVNYIPSFATEKGIDTYGHGTHVCGIIAAIKNNGKGGYGVAPDVSLNSIQVTKGKTLQLNDVAVAVNMAIEMDVDVINMSLGGDRYNQALQNVIDNAYKKGIVCVAAAGNSNTDSLNYPAACDHVIAVGATNKNDEFASYSNYGEWVNILAPGGEVTAYNSKKGTKDFIYSTYYKKEQATASENVYGGVSGTSQATPMVAGVAALCYSVKEDFKKNKNSDTVDLITMVITATSDGKEYKDTFDGKGSGVGLVQADLAVLMAQNMSEKKSHSLVDEGGHYGSFLSGYLSAKKSFKLKIGDSNGAVGDKSLTKAATWESSDTGKVTVKNGKVKATKSAKSGDRVLITVTSGGDTLYYMVKIHDTVKKMGVLRGNYKIKTSEEVAKRAGQPIYIANPYAAISQNSTDMAVYYTTKKSELAQENSEDRSIADSRFAYDISISGKDLGKLTVNEEADNGDPISITPNHAGDVIKVKYKLLDGSKKKFTLKIIVN
ncbi:MAG: S8 family serine peptidase [Lachnospiraceae bacterium]|nr:S8 family serine peptidase [Lachnospiraceae bacterium]